MFLRRYEYALLAYRILLVYLFYFLARLIFYFFNQDLIPLNNWSDFFTLSFHGLTFDTTAILYINGPFILFSILPFKINTSLSYQKALFYLYFPLNFLFFSTNFIDTIYYPYNFGRSTIEVFQHFFIEKNKGLLLGNFLVNYWYIFLLFFISCLLWIYLYQLLKPKFPPIKANFNYFFQSFIGFVLISLLIIGGIRGGYQKSTRPINLIDANRYAKTLSQADLILNSPFTILRTLNHANFPNYQFYPSSQVDSLIHPIKYFPSTSSSKPNIVIFILESHSKEYYGALNQDSPIPNFKSYTPFLDSLANYSLIFPNAYANGYKSIHALSSILAGIPSFKTAFTSSPYANQKTESLVSCLKSIGYSSAFFHGAENGSMGFWGYSNILGIDHYFGKKEYPNPLDFDGVWGIWDEPFMQFFNQKLQKFNQPFLATFFSLSSHEPYQIPEKYQDKFPKGHVNIHPCIAYSDYAIKKFFESAQKEPWFENTLFVFVGDHGNTIYYDEYKKELNKNKIALMFYRANSNLIGINNQYAQHIDIYPTILDLIGYDKSFRSWGRSLVRNDSTSPPFVIRYSSNLYQYMEGNYILCFDGNHIQGIYHHSDKDLKNNLIHQNIPELPYLEMKGKAFLQDYMKRIKSSLHNTDQKTFASSLK